MTSAVPAPTVIIRDMGIDDIAPVFHLGEALFKRELYPTLYRTWDEWEVTGLYNTDPEYCLIADINEQFAGFLLGTILEKPNWVYGYIIWLGVNPECQRQGVADRLVDKFIERTIEQGASTILMDTDPQNEPAVKFFNRKGFNTPRQHIYLSLDLTQHEYYRKLIAYEHDRVERLKRRDRSRRSRPN